MRLYIGIFIILSLSSGALLYYNCAKENRRKTQVEQNEPSTVVPPAAVHQPQAKNETANSYDAGKDCLYRLYLFATVTGVFVALGGIYVIWKQTEATEKAADAALLNAQAVINSQRSWIAVRTKDPPIAGSVEFMAECLVGIPAKMIHNYANWKAVEKGQSLQPIYDTEMLQYPFLVAPSDGKKRVFEFGIESLKAHASLWNDIQNLQQTLYFFGKIEYTDGVSIDDKGNPIVHETKWCYLYIGGAIVRGGPPGMNDCT
jgi:hypothetical protein